MPHNICIFEDKKFSNFFPLSLSHPVFDLRIGLGSLRSRLQEAFAGVTFEVICRDYLAPIVQLENPKLAVNTEPGAETLFVNGRLLCYGGELKELMDKIPQNHIAVKGGYVVAARLPKKPGVDFAAYIHTRISEESIDKLCQELASSAQTATKTGAKPAASGRRSKKLIETDKAEVGPYEDAHALGQDNVEEKLPIALTELIKRHGVNRIEMPEARLLSFAWQIIEENPKVIEDDFTKLPFRGLSEDSVVYPGAQMIEEEKIFIGEGAVIKSGVVLDASDGPITIGDRTLVMPNTTVIGPASIGADCLINTGAKILEGTSIGNVCKVGGEIDCTIMGNYSNKQHDGFIGHSYLGEWINIGAASNNSDLKNNYGPVRMWCAGKMRETGRQFLGTVIGDHTKTGINTLFNTGTVIGFNCNIYSSELPDKFVPSFSWGHGMEMSEYDLIKAMQTAEVVMERRKIKFTSAHKRLFEKIHTLSQKCARNI